MHISTRETEQVSIQQIGGVSQPGDSVPVKQGDFTEVATGKENDKGTDQDIDALEHKLRELEEIINEREIKEDTPMIANPGNPSQEEIESHELTHANYKSWCKVCRMGLARREAHKRHTKEMKKRYSVRAHGELDVPDTEEPVNGVTKYSMDYAILKESGNDTKNTILVMVNHEDGGIFTHAVTGKGILGERLWIAKRIAKDIDNCGTKEARVQVKSDQEPAIVALQEEIRETRRGKTYCVNSPVAESECNGRAENAILRTEVKIRTLRAALECKFKEKVNMQSDFATWLI